MNATSGRAQKRGQRGAVLIEGTLGISIVLVSVILMVLLLINVGLTVYYKNKLLFVTQEAASFAANQVTESGWSWHSVVNHPEVKSKWGSDTKAFTKQLIQAAGLPAAEKITVTYAGSLNPTYATVAVKLKPAGLIAFPDVFGDLAILKDQSSAIVRSDQPPAYLGHYTLQTVAFGGGPYNPTYGRVTGPNATSALAGQGLAVFRKFRHQPQIFKIGVPSDGDPLNSFWADPPRTGPIPH